MTAFLKQKGGYKALRVYQVTVIIYDITYYFTKRFLKRGDRTIDQMVQAARSGKQNIAEGSEAATTSAETEIKLTNVAKASLEELLLDYEDYLRTRNKIQWKSGHPRFQKVRSFASSQEISWKYPALLPKCNDEELANLCITLIQQATYMLKHLIKKQQEMFLQQGGIREQMYTARQKNKLTLSNNQKTL